MNAKAGAASRGCCAAVRPPAKELREREKVILPRGKVNVKVLMETVVTPETTRRWQGELVMKALIRNEAAVLEDLSPCF